MTEKELRKIRKIANLTSIAMTTFFAITVICIIIMQRERLRVQEKICEQQEELLKVVKEAKDQKIRYRGINRTVLQMMVKKYKGQIKEEETAKEKLKAELKKNRPFLSIGCLEEEDG